MILHRLHLNLRCREVRRDLADPYQMHATLCRAFSPSDTKCPAGTFLWRLEPEPGPQGSARLLVQSSVQPEWNRIPFRSWLVHEPEAPVDLRKALRLDTLTAGRRFRFRLRANPSTSMAGKRIGILQEPQQAAWLTQKGMGTEEHPGGHGFRLPSVSTFDPFQGCNQSEQIPQVAISQGQMLRSRSIKGREMSVFATLFEGQLEVVDPDRFRQALEMGIGHGKAFGLGLMSVVPLS